MKHKAIFIQDIDPAGGPATDFFQVASVERKTTKRGSAFLDLKLRDRTGEVDAKLWDVPPGFEVEAGQFVEVRFEPGTYKDALQLKITKIAIVAKDDVAIEDYIPVSKRDRHEMLAEVLAWVERIQNQSLKDALSALIADQGTLLRDAPAAKKKHQAYLGGLLEHVLALCSLGSAVSDLYPVLNRDILIASAIVHDIGKIQELVYDDHIGYTRAGSLTGHIIQGSILWDRYAGQLDPATRDHIQHIIASHHGRRDWGAAQVPMTREAHVFHLLDMIDARVELIGNLLSAGVNAEGFTPYDHSVECAVWSGK